MIAVDRTRLPSAGAARPFRFPAIARATVAGSGLDLRVVPHHAAPVVSITALVRGGSSADPVDRPGLAAFTADLLDDGAGTLDGPGLADVLARIGAEADIEVWPDATVVTITTLSRHVERALALLADLLMRPRFNEADVTRVRALRLDRLRQMRAQAASIADRAFTRAIYGTHPYGHPGIGDPASVEATTVDDIRAAHARGYRAPATTLVLAGDLDIDTAQALATAAFGAWPSADPAAFTRAPVEVPAGRGRVLLAPRPGAPQSELRVGQVSASRATPDYHALLLWNAVLGGQFVSRLNLNLRQAKGYTYGVRSGFDFRCDRGPFSIHTSVQASATADALAEILREVTDLASTRPMNVDELTRARAAVGLGYPRGFETAQQVARAVAQMSLHDLSADHFAQFVPRLDAVTLDEVGAAAARHVHPDRLTAVVVGDPGQVGPQLAARSIAYETLDEGI
jgi:predicted Zn-dependent peptidase